MSFPHFQLVERKTNILQGLLSIPSVCSVRGTDQQLALKQCPNSEAALAVTFKVSTGEILENSTAADHYLHNAPCRQDVGMPANTALDKVEVSVSTLYKNTLLSDDSTEVKVENSDNIALSTLGNGVNDSSGVDAPADKVNNDAPNDLVDDDLDHIVLKERQRMMLKRYHFFLIYCFSCKIMFVCLNTCLLFNNYCFPEFDILFFADIFAKVRKY